MHQKQEAAVTVTKLRKYVRHFRFESRQWSTADAEIEVASVEKAELTNVLPLKPGVGQSIATHASSTARNFLLVLISQ